MTPEWKDAFSYATTLADQLGLEMAIAGSPGWSESGGPWVTPAAGHEEARLERDARPGGQRFTGALPKPPTTNGPFQNAPRIDLPRVLSRQAPKPRPEFYQDSAVIAYQRARRRRADERASPGAHVERRDDRSGSLADGDFVKSSCAPHGARGKEGLDPVRFRKAGDDPRRVACDRRFQVAVWSAAARSRSRGERRRPDLQEDRQHSRAARPSRTRCRLRRSGRASSAWLS